MSIIKSRIIFCLIVCFIWSSCSQEEKEVLPTPSQVTWADAEVGALFHLDVQVFEPEYKWRETRDYQPDASVFNPKDLDTDQWIASAKAAGATYAVLVAKHCSGFSLWPTEAHDYSVKNSPWRNGEGDIVKDFISSCNKYGLKPGLYASASANAYYHVDNPGLVLSKDPEAQKAYNQMVATQLTELWSNYGDLFEIWFDGGVLPVEKGGIDMASLLLKHQPEAITFQGPFDYSNNIRWVGNEEGVAPYPCWSRADSTTTATGMVQIKGLNGNPEGAYWCPGEADFALRKWTKEKPAFQGGWFWHEGEEDRIRPLDDLMNRYYETVGRNTNMLLGIVIDDRGLIPEADSIRLKEFGEAISEKFTKSLGSISGEGEQYYISFEKPQDVSCVVIEEDIANGERVREYDLFGETNQGWELLSKGQSIGHKRIEVLTQQSLLGIKLKVTASKGHPILSLNCF